uniref:Major facilitator superfamily (MFS) profile domain-containing protein n=1 Tax=Plectus sambesii TaxID=2011161 RepID=A0A914VA11_9BILA
MMEIRDSDADGQRDPPDFDPTPGMRSLVFASGAVGALTFIPAAVALLRRIGARKTFAIAGMLSASATVLTPLAVRGGLASFALARLVQGASLSSLFPVIGGVSAGWSTLKYSGLFLSVITSFVQLAPIFTVPVAGSLCVTEAGWPMAYYVHAMITVFFFTLWAVFFKDTPHGHRWITDVEIKKIMEGKPPMPSSPRPVPFRAILSSPTIWVIWLTALANFAGMQLFIIYMANFISNYLGYTLRDSCLLAALPPLVQFFTKIIAGILGDRQYSFLSATSKVRVFNSVASIGSGAFLLGLVFVPPTERFWSIVLLMLSASFLGFNTSGLFRSPSLVARQHTHFVMTIIQVLLCVCLLGMPFVVELLTSLKSPRDWSLVFGAVAFFLIITNVLYCIFAKGSPAPWTVIKEQSPAKIHPTNDTLPPSTIVTVADSNTLTN